MRELLGKMADEFAFCSFLGATSSRALRGREKQKRNASGAHRYTNNQRNEFLCQAVALALPPLAATPQERGVGVG